jgi:CheY-specific phosphatase CheX
MGVKFFGQYLVEQGAVSREMLLRAIELQETTNLKFGEMALSMGLITAAQLEEVHHVQWQEDLQFGEIAIRRGILNEKQVEEVLTKQRNSHLYIGEALFKVGALDREDLSRYLVEFKRDQAPYKTDRVALPDGLPLPGIWEITADLSYKMLARIANLAFKASQPCLASSYSAGDTVAAIDLGGDVTARYVFVVSGSARAAIARSILQVESVDDEPAEVMDDSVLEFINVVCGNLVAKTAQIGKQLTIAPPQLLPASGMQGELSTDQLLLLLPLSFADSSTGEIALIINK